MPFVFIYLIRLTIAIALFYCLYRLLLRQLTFYKWNRYYLAGYGAMSLVLPFMNFDFLFSRDSHELITSIPSINSISLKQLSSATPERDWLGNNYEKILLALFIVGVIYMIGRIIKQYRSLSAIRQKAVLVDSAAAELYDVEADISPFSFNNSIYFNSRMHHPEELTRILQHEFVHVRQKHSIDLLIMEVLCVVNWFNPFVWLMRKAVRENLEFIADSKVLETGVDAKEYQYLLLKVTGVIQSGLSHHFNISSLKKRIRMMNKIKSAKVHLLKFLFVLPLLCLVLISFRDDAEEVNTSVAPDAGGLNLVEVARSFHLSDTVPPPPPPRPPAQDRKGVVEVRIKPRQLPADVESIETTQKITVKRKDGKVETFDMNSDADVKAYRKKYNTLPPPPPMPPAAEGTAPASPAAPSSFAQPPAPAKAPVVGLDALTPRVGLEPLIVLNGKEMPLGSDLNNLVDPDKIESIEILKDKSATDLYGPAATGGVIKIVTKPEAAGGKATIRLRGVKSPATAAVTGPKKFSSDLENFDGVFVLNGKEVSKEQLSKVDPASIVQVDIMKNDARIDKNGKKTITNVMQVITQQ